MKRALFALSLLATTLLPTAARATAADAPHVLVVVSSEGREGGRSRPGFEMDELAQAWLIFHDNGLAVTLASPAGGPVEADRFDPEAPWNARLLALPEAAAALADTRATASLDADGFDAVYVVGGKGAMFDLPRDAALARLIGAVHDAGGVVAAVCHGPAALAEVRLADGNLLVAGRALTGFSNEEEAVFGKRWAPEFPWLLEDALRERGARWQEAPLMMPKVVVDDRLVTGQNPYSTPALAETVIRTLGRAPVARTPWREERAMALVQRLLAAEGDAARAELAADPAGHHVELIGLLGYYQLQAAQADADVARARAIMELARPHMDEPRLDVGIADAHWRLGEADRAQALLDTVLAAHPDLREAAELKARLDE
ncbi:MAG: DJ-1/PfpI family protein [Xanthomonadales bacterium]|nr:DJ-1/PfpI family protein [Xanthomonadales bacterium]